MLGPRRADYPKVALCDATSELKLPSRKRSLSLTQRIVGYGGITIMMAGLFAFLRADVTVPVYRRYIASTRIISTYLSETKTPKLQIGAGPHQLKGWLNTDIQPADGQAYLDASARFPLPNGSMRYVFSEQVIEHLNYEQGENMLKECYRVLALDGKMRIATPDLSKLIAFFSGTKRPEVDAYFQRQARTFGEPVLLEPETLTLNRMMHFHSHQFVYTPTLLRKRLERAGFHDIKEVQPGKSDDASLHNIDFRTDMEDNRFETMIFEATR